MLPVPDKNKKQHPPVFSADEFNSKVEKLKPAVWQPPTDVDYSKPLVLDAERFSDVKKKDGGSESLIDSRTSLPSEAQLPSRESQTPTSFLSEEIDKKLIGFTGGEPAWSFKSMTETPSLVSVEEQKRQIKEKVLSDPKELQKFVSGSFGVLDEEIKSIEQNKKNELSKGVGYGNYGQMGFSFDKHNEITASLYEKQAEKNRIRTNAAMLAASLEIPKYLENPSSFNPEALGRDIVRSSSPDLEAKFKMVESGGRVLPGIQKADLERMGIDVMKNYINNFAMPPENEILNLEERALYLQEKQRKEPLNEKDKAELSEVDARLSEIKSVQKIGADIKSYENDFAEKNYEYTGNIVKEKLGAFLYKRGESGVFGYSADKLLEYIDHPDLGLTDAEKNIAKTYVIPIERKIKGTNIPGSGLFRSGRSGVEQSVTGVINTLGAWTGIRTESEQAFDLLNAETKNTRYSAPGESQRALQQLEYLNNKEKSGEKLTESEIKERSDIEKYTNVRDWQSKAADLIGNMTGQVGTVAVLSRGVGGLGRALGAAGGAIGSNVVGMTTSAVGTALRSEIGGLFVSSYLMAKDNYDMQAIDLMPNEEDAAARKSYSTFMSGMEAATELIFRDTKVLAPFMKSFSPKVAKVMAKQLNGEITRQAAQDAINSSIKNYVQTSGKEMVKSMGQNAKEEALIDFLQGAANSYWGGGDFDVYETGKQATETFASTFVGSVVIDAMAGHGAYKNRNNQNNYVRSTIADMAINPARYKAAVEDLQMSGDITQNEANEKMKIINLSSKYLQELPQQRMVTNKDGVESNIPFDYPESSSYILHRVNEELLTDRLKSTSDPVDIARIEKDIDNSRKIREGIYNAEIGVTPDIEPVTDNPEVATDLGILHTDNVRPSDLIGTPFEKATNPQPVQELMTESDFQPVDQMFERVRNAEEINVNELNEVSSSLYDVLDKNPEAEHLIAPLINQLDNYEFSTKTETIETTEVVSTQIPTDTRKRNFDTRPVFEQLGSGAGRTSITRDGRTIEGRIVNRDGQYQLVNNDGESLLPMGQKEVVDVNMSLADDFGVYDENGDLSGINVVMPDGTQITFDGFKNPDIPLDIAIQISSNVIDVPNEVFDTKLEEFVRTENIEVPAFQEPAPQDNTTPVSQNTDINIVDEKSANVGEYFTRDIGGEVVTYQKQEDGLSRIVPESELKNTPNEKTTKERKADVKSDSEGQEKKTSKPRKKKELKTEQDVENELAALFGGSFDRLAPSISVEGASMPIGEYLRRANVVLKQLFPDASITVYDSSEQYYEQEGRPVGSMGVFHPKEMRLALNVPLLQKHNAENTVFHEVIHPIVNEAIVSKENALNDAWDKLLELKDLPGMSVVFDHVQAYEGRGAAIQKVEGITEFLTQVADGNIDVSKVPTSTATKILDLINYILESIGVGFRFSTAADIGRLATTIKEAFDTGNVSSIANALGRTGSSTEVSMDSLLSLKEQQLEVISRENPAPNSYNTWIRKVEDILTAQEAFSPAIDSNEFMYPDFSLEDMKNAINSNKVRVYSSYPISNGVFVTPSKMNAESYSYGKIYSKVVSLDDVAWIDEGEGQLADVSLDSLSQQEQEEAIRDIISRAQSVPVEKLKALIQKQTGWSDAKVNSLFPKEGVGISHAKTDEMSERLGLPKRRPTEAQTFKEWKDEAHELILDGYNVGDLISRMHFDNHIPDPVENAIIAETIANLENEIEQNPTKEKLDMLYRIKSISDSQGGTKVARSLVSRNMIRLRDNSLAGFLYEEREAKDGGILTDSEFQRVKREYNEIKDAQLLLEKKIAELIAENNKPSIPNSKKNKSIKKSHSDFVKERKSIIDSIKDKWNRASRGDSLMSVPVPYAPQLIAISPDVMKLVRSFVEEGVTNLHDIVSNVHKQVRQAFDFITEKDIHDIIAGDYSVPSRPKSEIQKQISDLKTQADLENELSDLLSGKRPVKKDVKPVRTGVIKQLQDQISELREINRLNDRISDLENGKTYNEKQKKEWSKEVESLRKRAKDLAKKSRTDEQRLSSIKKATQRQIDALQNELDTGVTPETPKEIKLDKEAKQLKDKLISLRSERDRRIAETKFKNRSTEKKIADELASILNVPRTIKSSLDFSAVLRQAIIPTISHPILAIRSAKEMFIQTFDKKAQERWMYDLKNSDEYDVMVQAGLYIADPNDIRLSAKEERFQTNYVSKIPILGGDSSLGGLVPKITKGKIEKVGGFVDASERAYVGYLNKMRVDLFKKYIDALPLRDRNMDTYEAVAIWVNNATGRGGLSIGEAAAPMLNGVFFSPRLAASRMNILGLSDLAFGPTGRKGFYRSLPPSVRKMAATDIVKFLSVGLVTLGLFKIWEDDDENGLSVELDPRSSDFGKIRYDNVRYDIWGGFQQYVRSIAQLLTGESKSTKTGEVNPITDMSGSDNRGGVIGRSVRSKLAPVPSSIVDLIMGEDMIGQKTSLLSETKELFEPLSVKDIMEAWKEGSGIGTAVSLTAPFGVGVQIQKPHGYDDLDIDGNIVYKSLYNKGVNMKNPEQKNMSNEDYELFIKDRRLVFEDEWENIIQNGVLLNEDGYPTLSDNKAVGVKPYSDMTYKEITEAMRLINSKSTRVSKDRLNLKDTKDKKNEKYLK